MGFHNIFSMQVPVQPREYVSGQFRCGFKLQLNCGRRKNYLEDERSKRNTILRLPGFQRGKKVVHMVAVLTLTRLYDSDFKERLTINLNTSATKLPLFVYRTTYCRPNKINMVFILLDSLSAFDTVDHSFCCGGFRLISVSGVRF